MPRAARRPCILLSGVACLLIIAGCGREQAVEGEAPDDPPTAGVVEQTERAMARLEREHEADLAAQAARLERMYREQHEAKLSELQGQVREARVTTEKLEAELAKRGLEVAALRRERQETPPVTPPPPTTARVSVFTPPTPSLSRGPTSSVFPLRIYDVTGRKAVSGKHTTLRFTTTEELTSSGLDLPRKVRTPEAYEVDEYTYEVAFSAENLTRRPQTFSMRAGSLSRTAHLDAGETRTNLSTTAMMGAPLIITTGSHRMRFPIPAPVPAPDDSLPPTTP